MAGDRSPQPSKEAWEARKPEIHRWYLIENLTCDCIQKQLEASGFRVSERQIKNRLSEWRYERKKTRYPHYLAMLVMFDHYKARDIELEFDVPKREIRMTYSGQKVKKECERVRKRLALRSEVVNYPSFHEAEYLLQQENIIIRERHLAVQQSTLKPMQSHGGIVPWNGRQHGLPHRDYPSPMEVDIIASDGRSHTNTHYRQREEYSAASNSSTCSPFSGYQKLPLYQRPYSSETPSTVYTPQSVETPRPSPSSYCLSPATPAIKRESSFSAPTDAMQHLDISRALPQPDLASFPSGGRRQSFPVKLEQCFASGHVCSTGTKQATPISATFIKPESTFTRCRQCEAPHSHPDFDFRGVIHFLGHHVSRIKCNPSDDSSSFSENIVDQDRSAEGRKRTASRWAAPYYMQCVSNVPEATLQHSKAQSMEALRYALAHNNEFILPCLSWTMLILGQAERMQQLADFLRTSCEVINEQTSHCNSLYAISFCYAWAWASNDDGAMNWYGRRLEHACEQIRLLWGDDHSNFFVSGYLYAWDLLRRGDYLKAIELLTKSLPVCEKKMGRHDLLTINCLALISRGHGEMGHWQEAIHYLRKALTAIELLEAHDDHAHFHRPILQRFRLSLLGRHADLKFHLQDYTSAEKQFWRALHLCSELYGLENTDTWNAANGLGSVLQMNGKEAVWREVEDYLKKAWAWEHERRWLMERDREAPPRPPKPPCWWPFEEQEEPNAGSSSGRDSHNGGSQPPSL